MNDKIISNFYNLRDKRWVNVTAGQLRDAKIVRLKKNALKIVGWSQYSLDDLQNAAARIIKGCGVYRKEYLRKGEQIEQDLHVVERFFELAEEKKSKREKYGIKPGHYAKWLARIQKSRVVK